MHTPQHWVVIPAAGIGSRMQADKPKQYLTLGDKTILEHTLQRFLDHSDFAGVVVALSAHDVYWHGLGIQHERLHTCIGGAERSDTVSAALQYLSSKANANDWVWVHDAARPLVTTSDIDALQEAIEACSEGALLALPVVDTLKRSNAEGRSEATVDRRNFWRAQTPQVFRYASLCAALSSASQNGLLVTDEASAIEASGGRPCLVEGSERNIKITRPDDLVLADLYLKQENSA